mmetsp:Transcript_14096/g.58881  ORF Transcript_14096/g.58881 Transcript_14096/m.58881 type:complete len:239 (-) Transcript_14096:3204-3920(-)
MPGGFALFTLGSGEDGQATPGRLALFADLADARAGIASADVSQHVGRALVVRGCCALPKRGQLGTGSERELPSGGRLARIAFPRHDAVVTPGTAAVLLCGARVVQRVERHAVERIHLRRARRRVAIVAECTHRQRRVARRVCVRDEDGVLHPSGWGAGHDDVLRCAQAVPRQRTHGARVTHIDGRGRRGDRAQRVAIAESHTTPVGLALRRGGGYRVRVDGDDAVGGVGVMVDHEAHL